MVGWPGFALALLLAGALSGVAPAQVAPAPAPAAGSADAAADEFFEKSVRPLLADRCWRCHGDERQKSELRLDSRAALLAGGKHGPAAVEKRPEESLLIQAIRRDGERKMPPSQDDALDEKQVGAIVRWVELGLPWPDAKPSEAAARAERPITAAERAFWSFQPVADPAPPPVADESWPQNDLDRFVLAGLERIGLVPAPRADKRTLIRRATFDLIGLPPTPDEVAAFLADETPDAFAHVVDRLLASPHYGERQARHWLDVVRYADSFDSRNLDPAASKGDISEAWRYRDWVVGAFADDLPFAEFVQDQIAGDLRANDGGRFDVKRLIATGVLAIGNWGGGDSDKQKLLTDIADDQVDLVGRAFLGLTLGCARCHDHKFDPIGTDDYYGLAGIFFSSHILAETGPPTAGPPMLRVPLASPEELQARARRDERMRELATKIVATLGGAPLSTTVRDAGGQKGLLALRGEQETPNLLVNPGDAPRAFSTIDLPARCVTLHPSPQAGVAAIFTSPAELVVAVTGRVADADAHNGDGIEWTLERVRAGRERGGDGAAELLARGAIDNGGAMELDHGDGAAALAAVALARGDELRLTILPRANHFCDTTVVVLRLAEVGAARSWDLTSDVVAAAASGAIGNPLPAQDGASWRFVDRRALDVPPAQLDALTRFAAGEAAAGRMAAADASACDELLRLRAAEPAPIPFTNGVAEGGVPHTAHEGVHDVAVHVRGRYDRLGAVVPRRFPRVLAGDEQPPIASGSGRRELAAWLAAPENPLTARVFVNRIWQHHFGAGLVRTPGNFGRMGEAPTNPALLDWLTRRFLESGGSVKAMHRLVLLSSSWQQSSRPAAATLAADPDNRLVGRMNRMRLDAESLRDTLLAVAGGLDETRGGAATLDPATRRRTLYVETVRSDRTGARVLFDGADPTAIVDLRAETLVAPQSLWLMNDEFVLERAAELATRVRREAASEDARIDRLFELLFARPPDEREATVARALLARARVAAGEGDGAAGVAAAAFEELAHVLLLSNEFYFVD
jgi:mono/diheme cytochrome c family protein